MAVELCVVLSHMSTHRIKFEQSNMLLMNMVNE